LVPDKLPTLQTIVSLADVLGVHPLRLLRLVFDEMPTKRKVKQRQKLADASVFIGESIPDGTLVFYGQRFTKTWELQNTGKVPWEGRYLQCMDEQIRVYTLGGEEIQITECLIPDVRRIPVPYTKAGAIVKLSVEFTAPSTPGTCLSYWRSVFADGSLCFPQAQGLSVRVRVNSLVSGGHETR
jgi:hypothetical protein